MAKKRSNVRRPLKNPELIGKGKKETIQQILDRGANTPSKTIAKIKAENEPKQPPLHLTSTTSLTHPAIAKHKVENAIKPTVEKVVSKLKKNAQAVKPPENVAAKKPPAPPSK